MESADFLLSLLLLLEHLLLFILLKLVESRLEVGWLSLQTVLCEPELLVGRNHIRLLAVLLNLVSRDLNFLGEGVSDVLLDLVYLLLQVSFIDLEFF